MSAQIFGRDAEQQAIGAFLDAVQQGAGGFVLAGSAGSGKTTLLRAGSVAATDRGYRVLATMPARSDVRLTFAGLSDLLEPYTDAVLGELPRPQARALRVALLLEEAPSHPPEPRLIATAFRTALTVLARTAPVLVVIDDVQWLDAPSETAVGFAVRRLESAPVGLLCSLRTDRPGAELPLELGRARFKPDLLPVGAMSIGALHRMLRSRLGTSFSQPTLRRIEAESGGNPFIALEIGRALARRGFQGVQTGPLPVPDTLAGLVNERLGELPASVLSALQLIAVMPDLSAGQYLAAGLAGAELDTAAAAGVLETVGGRLRFSHPLLSSAVAGSIPPARLRELHAIAADMSDRTEEQARHRALAALGPSAEVAAELDSAAIASLSHGAPAAAAELLELAASLTPADQQPEASRRLASAARQLAIAGEKRSAMALLERVIASVPAGPERADALYQLGWLRQDDSGAEATPLLDRALAEAEGDPARAARIHLALCDNWSKRGDQALAIAEARHAMADAEQAGDPALIASALCNFVLFNFQAGAAVLDASLLERALDIESVIGNTQLSGGYSPSWVAGYCHLVEGDLEAAEEELQRVLAACDAEGIEYWRGDVLLRLSLAAVFRGDLARAAALAAEGLESTEQADVPQTISALLYACGEAAVQLGRVDEARDLAHRGVAAARQAGDYPYLLRNTALLGSVDVVVGNYQAAAERLQPLAVQWIGMGARILTTNGIEPQAVEALAAVGRLDEAASLVGEMDRYSRGPLARAIVARCRGELATARGDVDSAVAEFSQALRLLGEVSPQPVVRGRILLELAGSQRRLKQRAAARATLMEAQQLFERTGASLWLARVRADLARISGRAPGPEDMTATELRVAAMVAKGRSNKEAAAELFVSVRAVESTLTKVYAKLGVRSRTELAALLNASAANGAEAAGPPAAG